MNPLQFFIDLIEEGKLQEIKNDFIAEGEARGIEYNNTKEELFWCDYPDGDEKLETSRFADHLYKVLIKEYKTLLDNIRTTNVSGFNSREKRQAYFDGISRELNILIGKSNKKINILKYPKIKSCLESILQEVQNRMNDENPKPSSSKKTKQIYSFKWVCNPEVELPKLYSGMKGKFIDEVTTLEQFKAVYTGQSIDNITQIEWTAKINLLAYFIDCAFELNKFPFGTDIWATAKHCFVGANNLAQNKEAYLGNKKGRPKNYHVIDELFSTL